MKKFLLFLFFFSACFSYSQTPYHPFPEDSAQWSICLHGHDSVSMQPYISCFQIKMHGDTVLNGISYNKLYKSYDINYPSPSDSLHCFLRQDTTQKKVYVRYPYSMYNDSSDILLYDFSLQVNDTFNFKLVTDGTWHAARVSSIVDSLQTNVDYRRLFGLELINEPEIWGPPCDGCWGWVEGFGNNCYFLFTEIPQLYCDIIVPFDHSYNVQCFWENGIYVHGGVNCDFHTAIEEASFNTGEIRVYPNPVTNISYLKTELMQNLEQLVVINYFGKIIKQVNKDAIKSFTISTNEFPSGIYLLIAVDGNSNQSFHKFIIQH